MHVSHVTKWIYCFFALKHFISTWCLCVYMVLVCVHGACVCTWCLCVYMVLVCVHGVCVCTWCLCMYIVLVCVHGACVCTWCLCVYIGEGIFAACQN